MKFSGNTLWRVQILGYPDGSHEDVNYGGEVVSEPVPGWRPPGWRPEGRYIEIMGTDEFVWPVTNQVYGSRSTAKKRADLLANYGAAVVIERTDPLKWRTA